ncbi:geranylgeranyl reductase family protein [Williamsia sterculiae]|uniref:geranylgeranyl reductase family protein n=1 Tax=Williamsia sterculiae TaxID=1344003 RepID=UPI000970E303|nr:geranylgeranyl reductase family protein [Williamsia sterculiae]
MSADPVPQPPATADVLVVGAGPAGSAAAAHAARAGLEVVLLDAATFPRDKTCGDGLTPRAVAELGHLGLGAVLADRPRIVGLQLNGWGVRQEVRWPSGAFPGYGSAVRRTEFDDLLRAHAVDCGATMVEGARAVDVERDGDRVSEVRVRTDRDSQDTHTIRVRTLIVADGVRSTLGKTLGREWHRDTAYGVAARAYTRSARSDDPWMGSHLELRDADGGLLPGYGWVFPLGDGTVNIGVGALATARRPANMAMRPILQHYNRFQRDDWQLDGDPQHIASALLPMGGAVSGVAGSNWMLIGDAAACVNPLNGEGIDYGMETARLAVGMLDTPELARVWPEVLRHHYGPAFSAARRLASLLTVPKAVPILGRPGIRSSALMSTVVRVMGNLITPDDADVVARLWRTAGLASSRLDSRPPFT